MIFSQRQRVRLKGNLGLLLAACGSIVASAFDPKQTFPKVDACRAFDLKGWFSENSDKGIPAARSVADICRKQSQLELS
jgi:hypothetical protein